MNTKQDIGTKIKHRRRELKLSQEELADQTRVARQTISAWEQNFFVPKGRNLITLSKVLKAPISFFVNEEETHTPGGELPSPPAEVPFSFEIVPFARLYDDTQTYACKGTQEGRAEAIRILRLTINELEKADTPVPAGQ